MVQDIGSGIGGMISKLDPGMIMQILRGINFPARKQDIVQQARTNNASSDVMGAIDKLPDREYQNENDVAQEVSRNQ